jgi:heat shock protein HslJ
MLFNGRLEHTPLSVSPGELVRAYVVNVGPGTSAMHVMGTLLDTVHDGASQIRDHSRRWVSPNLQVNVSCGGRTGLMRATGARSNMRSAAQLDVADELQCVVADMTSFRAVLGVVIASITIGCSESSSTPTAPSSDQLAGTWNLVSIQPAGQANQPTPPGARYTLSFADGRLSTRVDCNMCSGGFALSDETLTAGPLLACTRAACPTIAFENAYTRLLSGDSTITLSDSTLVLSSSRGVLRFAR